jgi:hypothetical protein
MGKGPLNFNGYDWSELGPVLGLTYESFKTDEEAFDAYQKALHEASCKHDGKGDATIANGVRQFLVALEKLGGYFKPFFHGIRCVEHDGIMLHLAACYLGHLWS